MQHRGDQHDHGGHPFEESRALIFGHGPTVLRIAHGVAKQPSVELGRTPAKWRRQIR